MYKNYFFLLRCIKELTPIIKECEITEAYTQEKDKLFFNIPSADHPYSHLIISTNPQQTYLLFKSEHHKAKKNRFNFCRQLFPARFKSAEIAVGERVIRINTDSGNIFFMIRGGKTNLLFADGGQKIFPFKKIDEDKKDDLLKELMKYEYADPDKAIDRILGHLPKTERESPEKLPFIGKEIFKEVENREGDFREILIKIINEILYDPIAVFYDEDLNKLRFCPVSFRSVKIPPDAAQFKNYNEALDRYLGFVYSNARKMNIRKEVEKYVFNEIERLSRRLKNLDASLGSESKEKEYKKSGELLLTNINSLRKGMKSATLTDTASGEEVAIILDEKLSPKQNIDLYYEKSRDAKIRYRKSKELQSVAQREYARLQAISVRIENSADDEKIREIKKELKMKTNETIQKNNEEKGSFRHFLIEGKYHLYVGKDSKNNDLLTTRFARQNDFWFHARSVSGSHVVLRVDNTKDPVPKNILHKAACVAAFYSKAKSSKLASVTYTLKKYVVKNQRHDPGEVSITKESVLLVKPEIPKDCEAVYD